MDYNFKQNYFIRETKSGFEFTNCTDSDYMITSSVLDLQKLDIESHHCILDGIEKPNTAYKWYNNEWVEMGVLAQPLYDFVKKHEQGIVECLNKADSIEILDSVKSILNIVSSKSEWERIKKIMDLIFE